MPRNKKIFNAIIIVIAVLFVWLFIRFVIGGPEDTWICDNGQWVKHGAPNAPKPESSCLKADNKNFINSPQNATYIIENVAVKLTNGKSEIEIAPGSASKSITLYFGNEAKADLNGDGLIDSVFLLTQNNGGSGTFFYVVAALATDQGYKGTNAVLLGDRIAPQTTEIRDGEIIVNYVERNLGESMASQPSVGVSKYLKLDGDKLVEIIK